MIHIFVTGLSLAFDVSTVDRERFVPSAVPSLLEARCLDQEEALAIVERAGLVLAEVDPADGMRNIRTPGGILAGCIGQTDTVAEMAAHFNSDNSET